LHFGIEPERAAEIVGTPGLTVRAFLGYAGWSKGQLESEMKRDTWFVSAVVGGQLEQADGVALWRNVLGELDPELKFLAGEPDDPSVN
jgi:putative transcriptional regulator